MEIVYYYCIDSNCSRNVHNMDKEARPGKMTFDRACLLFV